MTTLMISKTGRCDAKCYNAKNKKCTCICGGINHGVGFKQAIKNMKDQEKDIPEWTQLFF